MSEPTYEELAGQAKERDGHACTRCGREHFALMAVRKDAYKPDTVKNLITVCRWCVREGEN